MNALRGQSFVLPFLLVATPLFVMSCAQHQIGASDKVLFERVEIGMKRHDVERILGKEALFVGNEYFYGAPQELEKWQSPFAPGSICVIYTMNNQVKAKFFYGQHPGEKYEPTRSMLEDLARDRIALVRVVRVDPTLERAEYTCPEDMDKYGKVVVEEKFSDSLRRPLQYAIDNSTFDFLDRQADLRWGAIFINRDGREIHSIYLGDKQANMRYIAGFIDWQPVSVNDELLRWMESNFAPTNHSKSNERVGS